MKPLVSVFIFLVVAYVHAQEINHAEEDFEYEMKHKNQAWYGLMKDGADYFEFKREFDNYFGSRQWEKSKPRSLGETWLKTKLYYIDAKGIVQPEPKNNRVYTYNQPLNLVRSGTTSQVGSWELLGPVNSAVTRYSLSGNHGGYVYLNRIDPTNPSRLFVSFVTGGLWMSTNGGTSWTLVDSNLPDERYSDIGVAISDPTVVYAISASHVIKSTDGGLNWIPTSLNRSNYSGKAFDIAVSTSNSNIVLARWGDKIYRTTDGGENWSIVLSGLPNHQTYDGSIHSEMLDWSTTTASVVYSLSTQHDNTVMVHRSADLGASFSQIATLTLEESANGQTVGWAKLMLPTTTSTSIYIAVGSGENERPGAHRAAHLYQLNATTGAIENIKTNMISGEGNAYAHDPVLIHGDICMDRNDENKIIYGSYGN